MSDSLISKLAALKQQRELQQRPFPLWALLILYDASSRKDTYCNHFEGFKLLIDWLSPIEIPQLSVEDRIKNKIPKLFQSYDIQEIATILGTTQEVIYHEYRYSSTFAVIQQSADTPQLPTQVSTKAP